MTFDQDILKGVDDHLPLTYSHFGQCVVQRGLRSEGLRREGSGKSAEILEGYGIFGRKIRVNRGMTGSVSPYDQMPYVGLSRGLRGGLFLNLNAAVGLALVFRSQRLRKGWCPVGGANPPTWWHQVGGGACGRKVRLAAWWCGRAASRSLEGFGQGWLIRKRRRRQKH